MQVYMLLSTFDVLTNAQISKKWKSIPLLSLLHQLNGHNCTSNVRVSSLTQISEAFKRFGISDGDDSVLVVLVHNKDESQLLSDITAAVDGRQVPVEDISSLSDQTKIKKVRHLRFRFVSLIAYNVDFC